MPVSFSGLHVAEPSPQARRLLWHVLSVGRVWRDEPEHHAGADKAGLHLFWVVRGSGLLETGETRLTLAPGRCCWLVDSAAGAQLSAAGWQATGDSRVSLSWPRLGSLA